MMVEKIRLGKNVLQASEERIEWIFDNFTQICVSFSGGKDSTAVLHLAAAAARRRKRKISILFIDWEAQFRHTIDHVQSMKVLYQDVTDCFYWIALPLTTPSAVSQYQTEWIAWQPDIEWVRQPPDFAITAPDLFPFYQYAMTFEDFISAFSTWFAGTKSSAILIGIRTDESLSRFLSISSQRKLRFANDKPWTTASLSGFHYNVYPIYDWKVEDIWTYFSQTQLPYNGLYDLMQQAGVALGSMRICEPFGPEQRRGLWLFHVLEPDTWAKVCLRVEGANSGNLYANTKGSFYAKHTFSKPEHHTWKSYALFLLNSMPEALSEHYKNKIAIYVRWYQKHHQTDDIPDQQENDTGNKDIPSWRRICKVLLRNDYWCRALSFSPTKPKSYERYVKRMKEKREQWKII